MKSYGEMLTLKTYEERLNYLHIPGIIGEETFGIYRYLNQKFYASSLWRQIRDQIIIRDNGCDLAIENYYIGKQIYIHHINPITIDDVIKGSFLVTDPENLVCTSRRTHDMIHYGFNPEKTSSIFLSRQERKKNDTCPWR